MIGETLGELRRRVASLADETGEYYLVCARTGERPVPADGRRFATRQAARAAARATQEYRRALRRYDPRLPYYDVIVCEDAVATDASDEGGRLSATRPLADFCHAVAGAVFEAVADSSHDSVETAVMDTYFEAAESVADPDELCLRMLESTALELDARLDPPAQATVLRRAATRLSSDPTVGDDAPVESALSRLRSVALLREFTLAPVPAADGEERFWDVTLGEYALGSTGRTVTLPLAVELFRRRPDARLVIAAADADSPASDPRLRLSTAATDAPAGLVTVSRSK